MNNQLTDLVRSLNTTVILLGNIESELMKHGELLRSLTEDMKMVVEDENMSGTF